MAYFDTTRTGDIDSYRKIAKEQNQTVLKYFQLIDLASPSQCHEHLMQSGLIDRHVPLTSIRRAITTLTKKGLLVKTEVTATGVYGRSEFCWRLTSKASEPLQLRLIPGGRR